MKLFSSYSLYNQHLNNRVVMAPMTRSRATGNIANDLIAEYYAQRADAGLIITEGTSPSPNGLGYARIPGIASPEQTISWQRVTDAVHARNGKIFLQMMHSGRVGSKLNLPQGSKLLAPSAVAMSGLIWTDSHGEQPYEVPAEMTGDDVKSTISEYAQAARNAISAGFDGVEIHGANGYLITQFLDPGSNQRSDEFGGDADRRNRFALDVAVEVVAAIGSDRTGIRLSPYGVFNDMSGAYDGIAKQYVELSGQLGKLGLHICIWLTILPLVRQNLIRLPYARCVRLSAVVAADLSFSRADMILNVQKQILRAELRILSLLADLLLLILILLHA